jgi:hypothetical protein
LQGRAELAKCGAVMQLAEEPKPSNTEWRQEELPV